MVDNKPLLYDNSVRKLVETIREKKALKGLTKPEEQELKEQKEKLQRCIAIYRTASKD